jgi:hypothetical protein
MEAFLNTSSDFGAKSNTRTKSVFGSANPRVSASLWKAKSISRSIAGRFGIPAIDAID